MRIELKETYEGEFNSAPAELSEKLSRGVEELRYAFNKSNPDGSIHVIDELGKLLEESFLKRTSRLETIILDTLRDGGSDAD